MPEQTVHRRKVLLVGWDAADWKVIRPLMAERKMPNLCRLIAKGCTASIATLQPSFSPMLWTTIATGKRPFRHGIHGFTEPRSDGLGVHRITNLSRKCKGLWNILSQSGLRSIVVGWWPSYPAEPIAGVMVSDQFQRVSPDFKLVPGMVHPAHLAEALAALRLNPEDLPAGIVEFFVPGAREIDQHRDRRLRSVARIIAECANIQTAATWLMDREPWDLCAVYFDAIDHFGHGFMKYHPPRRADIGEDDFGIYRHVVEAGYRLHDKMLGALLDKALRKAGDDATVILLSDHGFHPDHLRTGSIPQTHAGPAIEHRNNGIFAIAGPGIRSGMTLPGVSLIDIAPTVLALFGLQPGADMDGRILSGAFDVPPATVKIPTWEKVEGADGRHPPHMQLDPMAATESLDQLVALGYVEEPEADHEKAAKRTLTDLRTNLAESFQDAGRHAEALAILRELRETDAGSNDQRIALRLFISAQALRRHGEMAAIAADWEGRRRNLYQQALTRVGELRQLGREQGQLDERQREELRDLRRNCRYDPSLALYFEVQVFRSQRRWRDALGSLDRIPRADLARPGLFTDRAELLCRLNRWTEAAEVLVRALDSDPSDARVHFRRSRLFLHGGDFTAAAHAALDGLALLDQDPAGHYLLAIAMARLGSHDAALEAFTRALAINPNFPQAHLWLARIYRRHLNDQENASAHFRSWLELRKNLRQRKTTPGSGRPVNGPRPVAFSGSATRLPPLTDEVVIVTGLPRSGTSMLMQMLVAGGLAPLSDGLRQADEDNPRGYFEFEPVRQLAQGAEWFGQARGKVVKIVAPMIPHLPGGVPCRVILIERDFSDLLASQRQMIARRGREMDQTPARLNRLRQEYLRLIVWTKGFLATRPDTQLLCVNRNAILREPKAAADAMNSFLGGGLDVCKMMAEVKPELDRQGRVSRVT